MRRCPNILGLGYDEYGNGKFVPNEGNFTDEELESVFQQSYNENYYLLDATGIIFNTTYECCSRNIGSIYW